MFKSNFYALWKDLGFAECNLCEFATKYIKRFGSWKVHEKTRIKIAIQNLGDPNIKFNGTKMSYIAKKPKPTPLIVRLPLVRPAAAL